jgi:hypothetical protein
VSGFVTQIGEAFVGLGAEAAHLNTVLGAKPRSTETVLRSGDVVILGWRLAPSESFHDGSGKQGVSDQGVECGSRSGSSWTVVGHPEDCGQV